MKGRPRDPGRPKAMVITVIRSTDVSLTAIWKAFRSLPARDRDALPYVPRLLAIEEG